jgi:hypothetical protein
MIMINAVALGAVFVCSVLAVFGSTVTKRSQMSPMDPPSRPVGNSRSGNNVNARFHHALLSTKAQALINEAYGFSLVGDEAGVVRKLTDAIALEPNFAPLYFFRAMFHSPIEDREVTPAELEASIQDTQTAIALLKGSPPQYYDGVFNQSMIEEAESALARYQGALTACQV